MCPLVAYVFLGDGLGQLVDVPDNNQLEVVRDSDCCIPRCWVDFLPHTEIEGDMQKSSVQ